MGTLVLIVLTLVLAGLVVFGIDTVLGERADAKARQERWRRERQAAAEIDRIADQARGAILSEAMRRHRNKGWQGDATSYPPVIEGEWEEHL